MNLEDTIRINKIQKEESKKLDKQATQEKKKERSKNEWNAKFGDTTTGEKLVSLLPFGDIAASAMKRGRTAPTNSDVAAQEAWIQTKEALRGIALRQSSGVDPHTSTDQKILDSALSKNTGNFEEDYRAAFRENYVPKVDENLGQGSQMYYRMLGGIGGALIGGAIGGKGGASVGGGVGSFWGATEAKASEYMKQGYSYGVARRKAESGKDLAGSLVEGAAGAAGVGVGGAVGSKAAQAGWGLGKAILTEEAIQAPLNIISGMGVAKVEGRDYGVGDAVMDLGVGALLGAGGTAVGYHGGKIKTGGMEVPKESFDVSKASPVNPGINAPKVDTQLEGIDIDIPQQQQIKLFPEVQQPKPILPPSGMAPDDVLNMSAKLAKADPELVEVPSDILAKKAQITKGEANRELLQGKLPEDKAVVSKLEESQRYSAELENRDIENKLAYENEVINQHQILQENTITRSMSKVTVEQEQGLRKIHRDLKDLLADPESIQKQLDGMYKDRDNLNAMTSRGQRDPNITKAQIDNDTKIQNLEHKLNRISDLRKKVDTMDIPEEEMEIRYNEAVDKFLADKGLSRSWLTKTEKAIDAGADVGEKAWGVIIELGKIEAEVKPQRTIISVPTKSDVAQLRELASQVQDLNNLNKVDRDSFASIVNRFNPMRDGGMEELKIETHKLKKQLNQMQANGLNKTPEFAALSQEKAKIDATIRLAANAFGETKFNNLILDNEGTTIKSHLENNFSDVLTVTENPITKELSVTWKDFNPNATKMDFSTSKYSLAYEDSMDKIKALANENSSGTRGKTRDSSGEGTGTERKPRASSDVERKPRDPNSTNRKPRDPNKKPKKEDLEPKKTALAEYMESISEDLKIHTDENGMLITSDGTPAKFLPLMERSVHNFMDSLAFDKWGSDNVSQFTGFYRTVRDIQAESHNFDKHVDSLFSKYSYEFSKVQFIKEMPEEAKLAYAHIKAARDSAFKLNKFIDSAMDDGTLLDYSPQRVLEFRKKLFKQELKKAKEFVSTKGDKPPSLLTRPERTTGLVFRSLENIMDTYHKLMNVDGVIVEDQELWVSSVANKYGKLAWGDKQVIDEYLKEAKSTHNKFGYNKLRGVTKSAAKIAQFVRSGVVVGQPINAAQTGFTRTVASEAAYRDFTKNISAIVDADIRIADSVDAKGMDYLAKRGDIGTIGKVFGWDTQLEGAGYVDLRDVDVDDVDVIPKKTTKASHTWARTYSTLRNSPQALTNVAITTIEHFNAVKAYKLTKTLEADAIKNNKIEMFDFDTVYDEMKASVDERSFTSTRALIGSPALGAAKFLDFYTYVRGINSLIDNTLLKDVKRPRGMQGFGEFVGASARFLSDEVLTPFTRWFNEEMTIGWKNTVKLATSKNLSLAEKGVASLGYLAVSTALFGATSSPLIAVGCDVAGIISQSISKDNPTAADIKEATNSRLSLVNWMLPDDMKLDVDFSKGSISPLEYWSMIVGNLSEATKLVKAVVGLTTRKRMSYEETPRIVKSVFDRAAFLSSVKERLDEKDYAGAILELPEALTGLINPGFNKALKRGYASTQGGVPSKGSTSFYELLVKNEITRTGNMSYKYENNLYKTIQSLYMFLGFNHSGTNQYDQYERSASKKIEEGDIAGFLTGGD